jgi:hypothetical protein
MKRLILLLLVLPCLVFAQTNVSGNQSGTWTADNSPYNVTGNLTVPSGQTLNIEPGVEVNFQGHYKFSVNGNLQAIGSASSMITFTTDNQSTGWAGIRIDSDDLITMRYCKIEHGFAAGDYPDMHGGGMAIMSSKVELSNCIFADNEAGTNGMGGAIYAINPHESSITDCTFLRNECYGEGGAIKITSDYSTEFTNCEFIQNHCNYGGGAFSGYGAAGTKFTGCLFVDNYTMYSGGGAVHTLGSGNSLYFANCTFTENSAVTGDGGALYLNYSESYFVNTIVYDNPGMYSDDLFNGWGSTAEIYYCNLPMPDGSSGHHNINTNPLFVDAANYDFTLQENSSSVDAGVAYQLNEYGEVLVNLEPSQYSGTAPDIGAFEYSDMTDVFNPQMTTCKLYQNYPNPFTSSTAISYRLASDSQVQVAVFNVKGQAVKTLFNSSQSEGVHSLNWDGKNRAGQKVSAGTYFVKLQAGNQTDSVRMVVGD